MTRTDRTEPGRRRPDAADTDPIDDARAALREERARTRSERDAFEAFRSRVADVPAGSPRAGTPGRPGATLADQSADRRRAGAAAVREAYEATVMATPHYDEEYDEPYLESVAGEFGAELACALEADCEALADARQTELRDQRRTLDRAGDAPYLAAYLYGSLDVAYPVLASVATLVRRIRELRAAVETARASLATDR